MKICNKCGLNKNIKEFHKDSNSKDGHHYTCKECRTTHNSEYYKKNDIKIKATVSNYRKTNPDKIKNTKRKHYLKNRNEILIKQKKYRTEHPEIMKIYREKNYEKLLIQQREYKKTHYKKIQNLSKKLSREYRNKYPERIKAVNKINSEILKGNIKRQPCVICGDIKSEAHHPDYNKPLYIIWLCKRHHKKFHAKQN